LDRLFFSHSEGGKRVKGKKLNKICRRRLACVGECSAN